MPGFGFGFGSLRARNPVATVPAVPPIGIPELEPSADWVGTAGSGFDGQFGATPSDPTRVTAKPVCRLLVPDLQWFTDQILVGVYAGANNQGSLFDNMGLDRVICHYEGEEADIVAPSFQTFTDANGNPVTYFGWWISLKHTGTNGHAQVYFEAVPKDATMQNRVIGPFQFSPQASLHDYSVVVAPSAPVEAGVSYQSYSDARSYLRGVSAQNPLITFTEASTDHPMDNDGVQWHPSNGRLTVTATAPVSFDATTGISYFRPFTNGIHFRGSNITLDFHTATELYQENTNSIGHWLDGISITNSNGRNDLFEKRPRNNIAWIVRGNPWFTECSISYTWNSCMNSSLARGCALADVWGDVFNDSKLVIGNTLDNFESNWFRDPVEALQLTYTGSAATATIESSGTSTKTFTIKEDGSTVSTFVVQSSSAAFATNTNYTVTNIAAWMNGLTDWSATVIDDTRAGYVLGLSTGTPGAAFAAQSAKGVALSLYTAFDVHGDFWQKQDTGSYDENVAVIGNLAFNTYAQDLLFGGTSGMKDVLVLNNAFDNQDDDGQYSQMARDHQHVVIAHNSWSQQGFWFRTDSNYTGDGYCLLSNNVGPEFEWVGAVDADVVVAGNHQFAGSSAPSGSTGTTIGGTKATLFADATTGDFTPLGDLLASPRASVARYDFSGSERAASEAAGALKS